MAIEVNKPHEMTRPELVNWVKGSLKQRGLTLYSIAIDLGVHETAVSAVLRLARRSAEIEEAICKLADVPARARKVLFPPKDKSNERRKDGKP